MKRKILIGIIVLLSGFLLAGISFYIFGRITGPSRLAVTVSPRVPSQIIETSKAFSEIANSISPVVANISTTKVVKREAPSFFDDPFFNFFGPSHDFGSPKKWKEQSLGSGVIVSGDGYIITNNHVIEQAEEIKVTLYDKKSFKGKIVGADPKTDIAVIKINAENLPTAAWADSDKLQVGEFVLAIGNPFGLSHTVTMGIISAVGRASVGITDYEDFIQTDAAINPGNSGGPLVNIKGEVIGINTAIFSKTGGYQGIGFSVPSNLVRSVMEDLIKYGKKTRGWLGVSIQRLTPELAEKFGIKDSDGALVGDVVKGSPAEKAGIMRGDIVLEYNGKKVKDADSLRNTVAQTKAGVQVNIKILRKGKEYNITVTITESPKEPEEAKIESVPEDARRGEALAGLEVVELTKEIAQQLGLNRDEKGVVLLKVEAGSAADEAKLRKGDVIHEIDTKKVATINDFNKIASAIKPGATVLLFINRGGQKFYTAIKAS
ncbi:MAG: DegQ family serine endoprotease [Nitrospirae bacterium]|nr:DegQ family serine endoprotease [Nitrospirota bacterium]MBI3376851.1 DegQ family serine endoprotease [Nitrospirota bacterium]